MNENQEKRYLLECTRKDISEPTQSVGFDCIEKAMEYAKAHQWTGVLTKSSGHYEHFFNKGEVQDDWAHKCECNECNSNTGQKTPKRYTLEREGEKTVSGFIGGMPQMVKELVSFDCMLDALIFADRNNWTGYIKDELDITVCILVEGKIQDEYQPQCFCGCCDRDRLSWDVKPKPDDNDQLNPTKERKPDIKNLNELKIAYDTPRKRLLLCHTSTNRSIDIGLLSVVDYNQNDVFKWLGE